MTNYRVVSDGFLIDGGYHPPGELLRKSVVLSLPNIDALVVEGVVEVVSDLDLAPVPEVSDTPRVSKRSAAKGVSTDGAGA